MRLRLKQPPPPKKMGGVSRRDFLTAPLLGMEGKHSQQTDDDSGEVDMNELWSVDLFEVHLVFETGPANVPKRHNNSW